MPRPYLIIASFFILFSLFIGIFKDENDENLSRTPASVSGGRSMSDNDFIELIISSRKVNKVVKSLVETSQSLFFINSSNYLCFELGKVQTSIEEMKSLYQKNKDIWPEGQKIGMSTFLEKYPNQLLSLCEEKSPREIKTYLLQVGVGAKELLHSIYLDKHFARTHRAFYDQLEKEIDKKHQELIYQEMKNFLSIVNDLKVKANQQKNYRQTCFYLGKSFLPFYTLNTSYLNSSYAKNDKIIKNYGKLGRSISSVGPSCHRAEENFDKKIESIRKKAMELKSSLN